mmetsp:Transcript_6642/g.19732  ORF Transcript_6642/g.19732 Transcript_6642/m.19732 type:complete len:353 (-) Transcript_6642:227-1285(-)
MTVRRARATSAHDGSGEDAPPAGEPWSGTHRRKLEESFRRDRYPKRSARAQFARDMQVNERQVQIWFQNRRQRERLRMEERDRRRARAGAAPTETSHTVAHGDHSGAPLRRALEAIPSAESPLCAVEHNGAGVEEWPAEVSIAVHTRCGPHPAWQNPPLSQADGSSHWPPIGQREISAAASATVDSLCTPHWQYAPCTQWQPPATPSWAVHSASWHAPHGLHTCCPGEHPGHMHWPGWQPTWVPNLVEYPSNPSWQQCPPQNYQSSDSAWLCAQVSPGAAAWHGQLTLSSVAEPPHAYWTHPAHGHHHGHSPQPIFGHDSASPSAPAHPHVCYLPQQHTAPCHSYYPYCPHF